MRSASRSSTDGVEMVKRLVGIFHREDPTRPVTMGCDRIAANLTGREVGTPPEFLEVLDVVGYNYCGPPARAGGEILQRRPARVPAEKVHRHGERGPWAASGATIRALSRDGSRASSWRGAPIEGPMSSSCGSSRGSTTT